VQKKFSFLVSKLDASSSLAITRIASLSTSINKGNNNS
jgi:hypothetical protein